MMERQPVQAEEKMSSGGVKAATNGVRRLGWQFSKKTRQVNKVRRTVFVAQGGGDWGSSTRDYDPRSSSATFALKTVTQ